MADSLKINPPPAKKKRREQSYSSKYGEEFSFITNSKVSSLHAFCKPCRKDINISHGGRLDIVQHSKTAVHLRNLKMGEEGKKSQIMTSFFSSSNNKEEESSIINAECLFTCFLLEHNIPLAAADHIGPLLRKAFPKSEEVKKYAADHKSQISSVLQTFPYAISTDGSHTNDSKLYPIIISYPDMNTKSIKLQVVSIPNLEESSTGVNIGNLLLKELEALKIPISNCIAMGSDNAPVMLGLKSGVVSVLRNHQPEMLALGCPCHLINIAAQKAAQMLPVSVDSLLIDLFYYLEGSVNRKQRLVEMQIQCEEEVSKILKHVCTRWLSLGLCLPRLTSQWDTITKFVDSEVEKESGFIKGNPQLQGFKIPKVSEKQNSNAEAKSKCDKKMEKTASNKTTFATSSKSVSSKPEEKKSLGLKQCFTRTSTRPTVIFFFSQSKCLKKLISCSKPHSP